MLRLLQNKIKKPLAEDILFGRLAKGGVVNVEVEDDDLVLVIEETASV